MSPTPIRHQLITSLREIDEARGKKAKGSFNCDASVISYPTGYPTIDYNMGYRVNVFDKDNNIVDSYLNLGVPAGCYMEFIGKPSTSKTATAVCIAANIIRRFPNGSVIHYDFEEAMNYTRIQSLTRFRMEDMKAGQYILKQDKLSINDMKSAISELYLEKINNRKKYEYDTGKLNEFGEPLIMLEPTVVIIDSIATITATPDGKSIAEYEEVSTQTDRMRLTAEIGRFFNEIITMLKSANIILIAINQIKINPNMGVVKSPAELLYLQQDETLPGGRTPSFLASILIKFIASGSDKYTKEEEGFDGFGVTLRFCKSRVGADGRNVFMIYDKNKGMSMVRSTVRYLKDLGLVDGNKNGYRFTPDEDKTKFTLMNMESDFKENRILYKKMHDIVTPILEENVSGLKPEEMEVLDEELDFYNL